MRCGPCRPPWTVLLQRLALTIGALLIVAITAMYLVIALLPRTGLYSTYSVMTGSMEPAIQTGSVVVVLPEDPAEVRVGDIITVTSDQPPYPTVTHRVSRVVQTDAGLQFKTKGDANLLEDPWQFGYSGPAGRVWLTLPWLGYVLAFSATTAARLAVVGAVGLLLVAGLLPLIWRGRS